MHRPIAGGGYDTWSWTTVERRLSSTLVLFKSQGTYQC